MAPVRLPAQRRRSGCARLQDGHSALDRSEPPQRNSQRGGDRGPHHAFRERRRREVEERACARDRGRTGQQPAPRPRWDELGSCDDRTQAHPHKRRHRARHPELVGENALVGPTVRQCSDGCACSDGRLKSCHDSDESRRRPPHGRVLRGLHVVTPKYVHKVFLSDSLPVHLECRRLNLLCSARSRFCPCPATRRGFGHLCPAGMRGRKPLPARTRGPDLAGATPMSRYP